jgi:hypothetical protein
MLGDFEMTPLPSKLAEGIEEIKSLLTSPAMRMGYAMGAEFAATEILAETEKLVDALVKSNCDCSNYADCDRCSALLSWSNFIGQNQVDTDQNVVE